jgi:uncharacterized phage-like protein YoqJ
VKKEETCCFTGHRPSKLPWGENETDRRCLALKQRLAKALEDAYGKGMRHFICGMALGADFYFCEAAIALREQYSGVTVEAALPCEEQAAGWKERDRRRYFSLIEQCDYETMVQRLYDRQCMLRRDRYMVDRSAMIIGVYGGFLGGTMYTLSYAMKKGLETVLLELDKEDGSE